MGEKKINGRSVIVWTDFESADQVLNPNTLTPEEEKDNQIQKNVDAENKNEEVLENYQIRKTSDEKIKHFEITSIKKSKLYYFSFGEKNLKFPTPQNFRQLPSAFRNKYVLSDIGEKKIKIFRIHNLFFSIVPKITNDTNENEELQETMLEYIDDNPPIWQNMENELFSLAISGFLENFLR